MTHEIFYQLGDDEPVSIGEIPADAKTYIPFSFTITEGAADLNKGDIVRHFLLKIQGSKDKVFKMFIKPGKDQIEQ